MPTPYLTSSNMADKLFVLITNWLEIEKNTAGKSVFQFSGKGRVALPFSRQFKIYEKNIQENV